MDSPPTPQQVADQAYIDVLKGQRNAYADEAARTAALLAGANARIAELEKQRAAELPTLEN